MSLIREIIKKEYPNCPEECLNQAEWDHLIFGECFVERITEKGGEQFYVVDPRQVKVDKSGRRFAL